MKTQPYPGYRRSDRRKHKSSSKISLSTVPNHSQPLVNKGFRRYTVGTVERSPSKTVESEQYQWLTDDDDSTTIYIESFNKYALPGAWGAPLGGLAQSPSGVSAVPARLPKEIGNHP